MAQLMTTRITKQHQRTSATARHSLVDRAVGILAVDGVRVSEKTLVLLRECEAGTLTFDEARKAVISRAVAMPDTKQTNQD